MNIYILDTDIWTLNQLGHAAVRQRLSTVSADERAITVITVEEQLSGWYARLRQAKTRDRKALAYQHLANTAASFSNWAILSFTVSALARHERLQAAKLNVTKKDLCIAAITLEHSGILVSRNLRDFQRVPGLIVEDWSV